MPELPEIEVIKRSLQCACGKPLARIYFSHVAPVEQTTPPKIRQALLGKKIVTLGRRGKYLLFSLEGGVCLVIHLGMSGKLLYLAKPMKRTKHTHMEIYFTDGSLLRLIDPRRFGTISLSRRADESDNVFLRKLGLEYNDPTLSVADYVARFRQHPRLALKTALLHQGIIAGIGNIYACEALYWAQLDPRRTIDQVSDADLARLLQSIRKTIALAIRWNGTTLRDYLDGKGARGQMQNFLKVYGRHSKKVVRILQHNRATWFCPAVQK